MIAFDTNLLVRTVVADDPAQVAIVRQLIAQDSIWISRTVLSVIPHPQSCDQVKPKINGTNETNRTLLERRHPCRP